jgi:hypothetical protein
MGRNNNQVRDYESFKREFLNTWWSTSQQSLVKCSLYQDKYDKRSNMSLSAHFLKYATIATYLQPKLSELEIVEAIRFHYPLHIQRVLLTVQSKNISETLNLIKRIQVMEKHDFYLRTRNEKFTSTIDSSSLRLNQMRVHSQTNQRNNYEQRMPKKNYYLSERETQSENTRKSNHEENEYTLMKNLHSGN